MLGRILDAYVSKFGSLKELIPLLVEGGDAGGMEEKKRRRFRLELPVQVYFETCPNS